MNQMPPAALLTVMNQTPPAALPTVMNQTPPAALLTISMPMITRLLTTHEVTDESSITNNIGKPGKYHSLIT